MMEKIVLLCFLFPIFQSHPIKNNTDHTAANSEVATFLRSYILLKVIPFNCFTFNVVSSISKIKIQSRGSVKPNLMSITSNLTHLIEHIVEQELNKTNAAVSALENTPAGQLLEQMSEIPLQSFIYPPYFLPFYFPYGPYNVWLRRKSMLYYPAMPSPIMIPKLSFDPYPTFPSSDYLSWEEALKELDMIKQRSKMSSRIFPSITISSEYSGLTLTYYQAFASLLNKLRSSFTIYVTTAGTEDTTTELLSISSIRKTTALMT